MGLFSKILSKGKTAPKVETAKQKDEFDYETSYVLEYDQGVMDISIPEIMNHSFDFSNMPYIRFQGHDANRYLFEGENKNSAIEIINFVCEEAIHKAGISGHVNNQNLEFTPRIIETITNNYGMKSKYISNNDICYLQDNRFTKTGKISKNAYTIYFFDGQLNRVDNPDCIFGDICLSPEGSVTKAKFNQHKKGSLINVGLKVENAELVVSYIEKNGKNILNS